MVKDILKEDFPYFFSIGNHDGPHWSEFYGPFLEERIEHLEALHQTTICNCRSDFGVGLGDGVRFRAACTFQGFFFILSDIGFWPAGENGRRLLGFLFLGQPQSLPCGAEVSAPGNIELLDWHPDGAVNIADVLRLLRFLFVDGPRHPLSIPGNERVGLVDFPACGCK